MSTQFESIMEGLQDVLEFVKGNNAENRVVNKVINDLEASAKEVRLHRQGKIKLKTARELLDELDL